ncbi:MAG TPA: ferredoxin, partial [Firmicutes bacterium]|nr:ferredoxin [Bacillota bacterium]
VAPAFNKNLVEVECVNCGQCAAVCPTGAIVVKDETDKAWAALHDPNKMVVVQVAPAVRV